VGGAGPVVEDGVGVLSGHVDDYLAKSMAEEASRSAAG
jgi:hypothetical protein